MDRVPTAFRLTSSSRFGSLRWPFGFGKHGDDPGTRANLRSPWDTLHHVRDSAHRDLNTKDARASERIIEDIARHLAKYPPLGSIDEVLRRFLEEMRAVSQ